MEPKPFFKALIICLHVSMKIVECLDRLQRAVNYFEKNTEQEVSLDTAVAMANDGIALDWRTASGTYAGCEIHFDKVCDAFDRAGPDGPNWNAGEGDP